MRSCPGMSHPKFRMNIKFAKKTAHILTFSLELMKIDLAHELINPSEGILTVDQGTLLCSASSISDVHQGRARVNEALHIFSGLRSGRCVADAYMTLGHISDELAGIEHYDEALKIRCQVCTAN